MVKLPKDAPIRGIMSRKTHWEMVRVPAYIVAVSWGAAWRNDALETSFSVTTTQPDRTSCGSASKEVITLAPSPPPPFFNPAD